MDRIEAFFSGTAFAPHRHDTYAIGLTLSGVQSFNYRGAFRSSQPGHSLILHPDELHDGQAGTENGFRYRVAYIDPAQIQSVLGGQILPFVEGAISADPRLYQAVYNLIGELDFELSKLEYQDAIYDLAIAMQVVCSKTGSQQRVADYRSAELARQYIIENQDQPISLDTLEIISGRDRWKLSRDFRALFGTSPYRYLIMRRLETARRLMRDGLLTADVAASAHFADQSHLIRHFKKTYGMTPNQWLSSISTD